MRSGSLISARPFWRRSANIFIGHCSMQGTGFSDMFLGMFFVIGGWSSSGMRLSI